MDGYDSLMTFLGTDKWVKTTEVHAPRIPKSHVEFLAPGISDHCLAIAWLSKESNPMQQLFFKLKRLKTSLKALNHNHYNNIFACVKQKKLELEEQHIRSLNFVDSFQKVLQLQNELYLLEEAKNMFLRQKAKIQWLNDGDKCTKLFHFVVSTKTNRDTIRVLIDGQRKRLESYEDMAVEVLRFYTNLIGTKNSEVKSCDPDTLKELLQYSLPLGSSNELVNKVTRDEIKDAIFSQGNDKAPGPDGYTLYFFKKTWPIIGDDVVAAITHLFRKSYMQCSSFNVTCITLVPKIPNPSKWVEACFTTARYSISFNGSLVGFFKGARGLKQGDPISLLLFVLSMNVLSSILNKAAIRGIFGFHTRYLGLTRQGEISGLKLNAHKCESFTVGISPRKIEEIKWITCFNHGCLPVRYLGVPLVSRILSEKDCVALIDNIRDRLHKWSRRHLSYAGRLELIKTVMQSSEKTATGARVSWNKLFLSKSEGCLGLKEIKSWNKSCILHLIRKILAGDGSLWIVWIKAYVIKNSNFWIMEDGINTSWSFRKLLSMRPQAASIFASGAQSIKDIWHLIRNKEDKVTWHKLIWFPLHVPKYSIITLIAFLGRLPTKYRLIRTRFNIDSNCVLCNDSMETRDYLFLHCTLANLIWSFVLNLNGICRGSCLWGTHISWACAS
ncbi:uncharacterized protein LOC120176710 [Hibiscus syriacus]|uniref:uncharacterized protein LOC120176710 n=1 Tax=Hibiscus syriacus TaxID=106335 RepID=UPI0019242122|nr:uncharacterized protein LOC120176710 [Hibiscus syriacus]